MALSELITTKYPKDTLDIVVFGNDAWPVEIKDLPYLQVGPYHTNTVAGLGIGHGYFAKKKKSKQADLHDHGWKANLFENWKEIL